MYVNTYLHTPTLHVAKGSFLVYRQEKGKLASYEVEDNQEEENEKEDYI
jgi:hypothetical protein